MITNEVKINYTYGDVIYLKPVFDVHLGAKGCDVAAFRRDLRIADPSTWFLFGGDLWDSITVADPRYRKSNDAVLSDAVLDEQYVLARDILLPYKDRILGLGIGNHEDTIIKRCGVDMIARLCDELGVPHLGYSGLLRLRMRTKGGAGRYVIICYHHGYGGGGRTSGASLTKYEKYASKWDADIYLLGHDHQRKIDITERLGLFGMQLIAKPQILCVCGTYLKTFTEGIYPSYAERAGYLPVSVGGVTVTIKPLRKGVELNAFID